MVKCYVQGGDIRIKVWCNLVQQNDIKNQQVGLCGVIHDSKENGYSKSYWHRRSNVSLFEINLNNSWVFPIRKYSDAEAQPLLDATQNKKSLQSHWKNNYFIWAAFLAYHYAEAEHAAWFYDRSYFPIYQQLTRPSPCGPQGETLLLSTPRNESFDQLFDRIWLQNDSDKNERCMIDLTDEDDSAMTSKSSE